MKKFSFLLVFLLLAAALFVRVYRVDQLLRFYYDQGRDASVVTDMIRNLKPVLVGPTTGLAGILRGPAFYYLLLPAYLIGQGSPIVASVWLQMINTIGLLIFYLLARKLFSPLAGLLALVLMGFSAHMVDLSRWLSEPSMILTSVPLLLYGLVKISLDQRQSVYWPLVAFTLGLSLHFELASEIWFIPALFLLAIFVPRFRPQPRTAAISLAVFLATLLPQIIFDLRHDGIMRQAIVAHFSQTAAPSFSYDPKLIANRLDLYADAYTHLIAPGASRQFMFFLLLLFLPLLLFKLPRRQLSLPLAFILVPLLILLFYTGNSGNFYSYYLIGTFPLFLLLAAGLLDYYLRDRFLAVIALGLIAVFLFLNLRTLKNFLTSGIDGPGSITIRNQLDALDWIYQRAQRQPFNVDIYVPPVIPYSYDYLFRWYGIKNYRYPPQLTPQELEFTLYEVDPDSVRFPDWYKQNTVDHPVLVDQFSSGGVHVEFRQLVP